MLRRRYKRTADHLSDESFRIWVINVVAWLFDMMLLVIIAAVAGAFALLSVINERDARRKEIDDRLTKVSCLALHYTPPDSNFHKELLKLYPNCSLFNGKEQKFPSTRTKHSSSPAAGLGSSPTVGVAPSRPTVTQGIVVIVGTTPSSPAMPSRSAVARPTVTRAPSTPRPAPSTVTRTATVTHTATTTPRPAPPLKSVLCSPVGLPVTLVC